ncbi:MAG: hypothetical protein OSJ55_05175 [Bacteroidales bacterium]|nr:hypothetical protein [Bacteroidales bacterium]
MRKRIIFLCWLCVLLPAAMQAQRNTVSPEEANTDSLKADHKVSYFGTGERPDSLQERRLIDLFYYDQFRHFNDPRAPYFLFMSRDADLAMGIGGVVRMRGWIDWGGVVNTGGFIPYMISVPADAVNRRKIGSTPSGTALYFRVLGRNVAVGDYQLYIEANFNGYQARDFSLKKAYATINDWTLGYTNSTFSDPLAASPLVDGQGSPAEVRTTSVLLRWMHTWNSKWGAAASVEMPSSHIGANGETNKALNDWIPDIAAFVQYEWGYNEHIRLSAILRTLSYRDLVKSSNVTVPGWGLQLSSVFRPCRPMTIYATVNAGKGYGSLSNDLLMGNFDLVDSPYRSGRMYTPWAVGWTGAVQCYLHQKVFVSCTVGQMRYMPAGTVDANTYKYGLYVAANIFWNLTPRIQAAAEFNWGRRENFSGEGNNARRVSLVAQFAF